MHKSDMIVTEENETVSPFQSMISSGKPKDSKKDKYDLDSVEIGEFTETDPEAPVHRPLYDAHSSCVSYACDCSVGEEGIPWRDIRRSEEEERR